MATSKNTTSTSSTEQQVKKTPTALPPDTTNLNPQDPSDRVDSTATTTTATKRKSQLHQTGVADQDQNFSNTVIPGARASASMQQQLPSPGGKNDLQNDVVRFSQQQQDQQELTYEQQTRKSQQQQQQQQQQNQQNHNQQNSPATEHFAVDFSTTASQILASAQPGVAVGHHDHYQEQVLQLSTPTSTSQPQSETPRTKEKKEKKKKKEKEEKNSLFPYDSPVLPESGSKGNKKVYDAVAGIYSSQDVDNSSAAGIQATLKGKIQHQRSNIPEEIPIQIDAEALEKKFTTADAYGYNKLDPATYHNPMSSMSYKERLANAQKDSMRQLAGLFQSDEAKRAREISEERRKNQDVEEMITSKKTEKKKKKDKKIRLMGYGTNGELLSPEENDVRALRQLDKMLRYDYSEL
ncbi:unnamed protein product [Amoebophrya sp. A120]|nr:unnamed protein product [Amoebophrya sp. A120]|eukprot:GSA120T00014449001.1